MELTNTLATLANHIEQQRSHVKTEEAVKTAFILPFIQALGYNIFNPGEVIPEHTADHGVKKGEKVDYAIKLNEKIMILIECKKVNAPLETKYAGQLFRYFAVTEARFGVLTDGIRYLFYSDLDAPNKMDKNPFFEFSLLNFNDDSVNQLRKFTKILFNTENIISAASNQKILRELLNGLTKDFSNKSENIIHQLTNGIAPGVILTDRIKEQYTDLAYLALDSFVKKAANLSLSSSIETEDFSRTTITPEKIEAFGIVQEISAEITETENIVIRDAQSYCAILFKNNNRRQIMRLYFNKRTNLQIGVFDDDGEVRHGISRLGDIFRFRPEILESIKKYQIDSGTTPTPQRSRNIPVSPFWHSAN